MSDVARPVTFTSARRLANVTAVLLGLAVIIRLPLAVMLFQRMAMVAQYLRKESVNFGVMQISDNLIASFAAISGLVLLVTGIGFVVWMYRSYRNLPALGAPKGTFSPGWAIGGWFVPIAGLVIPCLIMGEIWKSGDPHGELTDPNYLKQARSTPLIGLWWSLMVAGNLLVLTGVFQTFGVANGLDKLMIQDRWNAISELVMIASALLGIAVLIAATGRQEERYERVHWMYGPNGSRPGREE